MAVLEVVDQVAERHPGPDENGRTAEDFRITVDDSGMLTHVLPHYTSIEPLSPLSAYLLQEACGPTMCCASRAFATTARERVPNEAFSGALRHHPRHPHLRRRPALRREDPRAR